MPLKVLLPGPLFPDSFVDNVADALTSMGHEVITFPEQQVADSWTLRSRIARIMKAYLSPDRPNASDRKLLRMALATRPDLILVTTMEVHPEVLDALGKVAPGRRVLWWGDPPSNSGRTTFLEPGWDAVYLKSAMTVAKLRLVGRNAHLLHEAMNPRWHRPVSMQGNNNILIAGNMYAFRQAVVLRLADAGYDLELYGPPPPRRCNLRVRRMHSGVYVTREEKSQVFGRAVGCLNTFAVVEGDALNCRAFEIAGAGGLQLIEDRPAIPECFEPGKELLTFGSFEELGAHIERAKREPVAMRRIREAASKRAAAEHTYQHRLATIIKAL
jgi:spore maturation protein CgeB